MAATFRSARGRSIIFCETVKSLGIDVETVNASWPLRGYGCVSPIAFDDFSKACANVPK